MKVTNTTENSITVMLTGKEYTVDADSTISGVPTKDAKYWQESLHNFIILSEEDTVSVEETVEEVNEEVKEEVVEEVKEEEKEEPKKATKKTTKKVTKK